MDYEKGGALSRHAKPSHGSSHHSGGGGGHPHVHFHKHDGGVSGHVMHHDGTHEVHHFDHEDHGGMAALLQEHMAGAPPAAGGGGGAEEPPEHMAQGASPQEEQAEGQGQAA